MQMSNVEKVGDVTDQICTISESISKYGFTAVTAAVAILVFICVILVMMKNHKLQIEKTLEANDSMMKSIVDQNNELITTLTRKLEANDDTHSKFIETYLDINIGLKSICKNIMSKINAERVAIYVFHNGNKSSHGLPFFKLSCIGEWAKQRNLANRSSQTDIPLYLFTDIVEMLYKERSIFIKDDDTTENISIIGVHEGRSITIYGIVDEYDNLAGFTLLEFDKDTDFNNIGIIDKIKESMEDIGKTISDIIIYTDIEKRIGKDHELK